MQVAQAVCAVCGEKLIPEEHKTMWWPTCKTHVGRDANTSRNTLAKGMQFGPDGVAGEVMVAEPTVVIHPVNAIQCVLVGGTPLAGTAAWLPRIITHKN